MRKYLNNNEYHKKYLFQLSNNAVYKNSIYLKNTKGYKCFVRLK